MHQRRRSCGSRAASAMRCMSYLLAFASVAVLAYVGIVLWRGDPITAAYTKRQQARLRSELTLSLQQQAYARGDQARRWKRRRIGNPLRDGSPLGIIRIPRLRVESVVIEGTSSADLAKGPGHYRVTDLPGSGGVVAIAAHRTTYGAWFRHVDELAHGDPIYVDYRGRTFVYRVTGTRIVSPRDVQVLRYRGYEKLVLSTCHPVYSAKQRLIVFGRLAASRPATHQPADR